MPGRTIFTLMKMRAARLSVLYAQRAVIVVLCMIVNNAYAQRYPFFNLNVEDGLVQSQATCLAQDKKGNLWIGTLGGLVRYDGKNFTNYTVRKGLLNNSVWAVAVDAQDNIWVGDQSGLSKFNGKSFEHFMRPQQAAINISNTQQVQVINDTVWWRVQGEVYVITRGRITRYNPFDEQGVVSAILAEPSGIWMAKDGVLYHLLPGKCDSIRFKENETIAIYRVFRDREGRVWVTASNGLYRADSGTMMKYAPTINQPILSITEDKAGALWLGASSGALRVKDGMIDRYNRHNGLRDNSFLDMFMDAGGNVWMASDGQGVFRYSGAQFTVLDEATGLPSAQVAAIASNGRDSLFLGTYDAGLYLFYNGKISMLPFPASPMPAIVALVYDSNSTLWIGTRGRSVWSYRNGRFQLYDAGKYGLPSAFINCLYNDGQRRLWIGFSNGAAVYENGSFTLLPVKREPVVSVLAIGDDSLLMATGKAGNMMLYHNGRIAAFRTNTIADSSTVQCFIKTGSKLWMGSSDNGVIEYDMQAQKANIINENNGLRSDFIYNIIADNDSNIWAGTGFGIHRISMKGGGGAPPQVTFFGKAHGITGMESNINSVIKMDDGSIWFGTTNGAVHYVPRSPLVSSAPASIVLQSVKLTGENSVPRGYYDSVDNWYNIPYHLRLPAHKNNISFTFQAISPGSHEQLAYRYRLEGLETPWSDWSEVNSAAYSALPPGKYIFHVQCRSGGGQNNPELSYAFEIITPFRKTAWFSVFVFTGILLLGILIQYLVNSAKQKRLQLLARVRANEQNKIREATAEDFHDEIGNKLTRINVLANVLKNKVPLTPDSERILRQIEDNTAQLYSGTRDILWSLKPSNDTLYEVLVRIRDFGMELFQDTDVIFSFDGIEEGWRSCRLTMDVSRNVIMIFKEALNNCLKYAAASHVNMHARVEGDELKLILEDDGRGFDMGTVVKGNGFNNMHIRTGRLNGTIVFDSRIGKGTSITVMLKIPQNG